MKISVILCTYNRCESLATALASAAALQLPDSIEWEVLVVDNNSNDRTREVIESFCQRFPRRFRYLFEPRPGKSNALNSSIHDARGQVLAFMDDDVTVDSLWLDKISAPILSGEWAGTGGRILPEKEFVPPKWLSVTEPYALAPLAIFDYGPEACELREAPFGTNMAFDRRMFEKYGMFRTDLGPQPGSEIRSEDTEFGRRLLLAGERFFYEPSARVYHSITRQRVRKEYFLGWWLGKARAEIREHGIEPGTKWFVAGVPLYLIRRWFTWTLRWMTSFQSARRFTCKLKVWWLWGMIAESRRHPAEPAPSLEAKRS